MELSRVEAVAKSLGLKPFSCPVIMIAGTNGKGTTAAFLEEVYCTAGYKTGVYTSPHLLHFNERIRLNQSSISDDALVFAFQQIEVARKEIELTYFEATTLAALVYFQSLPLDVLILEVGMGGRLDAVNIVKPNITIITCIDFDHMAYLGDTLEKIAFEKAGIIRADTPVIFGGRVALRPIIEQAKDLSAPLYIIGESFDIQKTPDGLTFIDESGDIKLPATHFHKDMIACGLKAIKLLKKLPVSSEILQNSLFNLQHYGRLQWIDEPVPTLLDVAHNPQSIQNLADYLKKDRSKGRLLAVFSALDDKNISVMIKIMNELIDVWFLCSLETPRAVDKDKLRNMFNLLEANVEGEYADPLSAYDAACQYAHEDDCVIVFGSFLTVTPVLKRQMPKLY